MNFQIDDSVQLLHFNLIRYDRLSRSGGVSAVLKSKIIPNLVERRCEREYLL